MQHLLYWATAFVLFVSHKHTNSPWEQQVHAESFHPKLVLVFVFGRIHTKYQRHPCILPSLSSFLKVSSSSSGREKQQTTEEVNRKEGKKLMPKLNLCLVHGDWWLVLGRRVSVMNTLHLREMKFFCNLQSFFLSFSQYFLSSLLKLPSSFLVDFDFDSVHFLVLSSSPFSSLSLFLPVFGFAFASQFLSQHLNNPQI